MRNKIVQAILREFRKYGPHNQEHVLTDALKRITSDANLIAFAQELGIDTDLELGQPEPHTSTVCPDLANHHFHVVKP